jgi:hypothetical protein
MPRMTRARAGEPPSELEQRYRRLLEEHKKSGLTQAEFAKKKGVPATTLSWWRGEIGHRDRLRAERNGNGVSHPPALVAVEILPATRNLAESKKSDTTRSVFLVRLRSGRELRVPEGFDAAELKRLVEVLAAC